MTPLLTLRPLADSDISLLKKWLYLPHIAPWYEHPADWINEAEKRHSDFSWLHHFITELNGNPIGFCQYYAYCDGDETWHEEIEITGTYSIDYLIGETDCLGRGFGKATVEELVKKIKANKDARRIIVQPDSKNKPSCNTLLTCGFQLYKKSDIFILEI